MKRTITVQITQDQASIFFGLFDLLGAKQKKIFQYLQAFAHKSPSVFPSHAHIAKKAGCSVTHVKNTLKKFLSYGWICWKNRGRNRSCVYFLTPYLVCLKLFKREIFMSQECLPECLPIPLNTIRNKTGLENPKNGKSDPPLRKEIKPPEMFLGIPSYLTHVDIPLEHKLKLAMVPQQCYEMALESARWKHKNGGVKDIPAYVAGGALQIAKKQGVKLNWAAYYETLRYHKRK